MIGRPLLTFITVVVVPAFVAFATATLVVRYSSAPVALIAADRGPSTNGGQR